MILLPDPRRYAAPGDNPLARLAAAAHAARSALQQGPGEGPLLDAVRLALEGGRDEEVLQGLVRAGSAAARKRLEDAIDRAVRLPGEAVGVQVFAFPLLLVVGGKAPGKIPGALPDAPALREILEVQGALGQASNVGLGNALASAEALEAIRPSRLYAMGQAGTGAFEPLAAPPAEILLETTEERVHLRFLLGAAVTPRDAPGVTETAGNIGAWGMAWTRALSAQLAQPGLSLLPVPRPPLSLRRAVEAGRFAWREMQFQLFLSRELRNLRASVGEPDAQVAAFADESLRVSLSTPLDEAYAAQFRWPLGPGDDLVATSRSILELLSECRLGRVDVLPDVQPVAASH